MKVTATDTSSGDVLWTLDDPDIRFATTNDGTAVVQTTEAIRFLDARTGAEIASHPAVPKIRTRTLDDDHLYVTTGC